GLTARAPSPLAARGHDLRASSAGRTRPLPARHFCWPRGSCQHVMLLATATAARGGGARRLGWPQRAGWPR
ncbi:hypothetical protein Dimus_030415, partial [Dionaea muscipula]